MVVDETLEEEIEEELQNEQMEDLNSVPEAGDELPSHIAENKAWVEMGKRDLNEFQKNYSDYLKQEHEGYKQTIDNFHAQNFSGKSAQEQDELLRSDRVKQFHESAKRSLNDVEMRKHKLANDPESLLNDIERKYETDLNHLRMEQKYGQITNDSPDFSKQVEPEISPDSYLDPELLKQRELQDKANTYSQLIQSENETDKQKANDMLNNDSEFRNVMKDSYKRQMENESKGFINALRSGEIGEDKIPEFQEQMKQMEDEYVNKFPEAKDELDAKAKEDEQKQKEHLENQQRQRLEEIKEQNEAMEKDPIYNPFLRDPKVHKFEAKGNTILHATDVHDNIDGLGAVFDRAIELKKQGKLNSVVLGGDLIRGVFDRDDLVKFQKVSERLDMLKRLPSSSIYTVTPLELIDVNTKELSEKFESTMTHLGVDQTFKDDLEQSLRTYADLYLKAKKSMHDNLTRFRNLAEEKGIKDYLRIVPGNYEGTKALEDAFDEHHVMGTANITNYEFQKTHKPEDAFKWKVLDVDGLKFFGEGGSWNTTQGWIPSELTDHYSDLQEQEVLAIRVQALGKVIEDIVDFLPSKKDKDDLKERAEKGMLFPSDLDMIEKKFAEIAKTKPSYDNDLLKDLHKKYEEAFNHIMENFQQDSKLLEHRIKKSEAHVHVAHHPIATDVGYFSAKGVNTGGVKARDAIYGSESYKLGLYGHSHDRVIDAMEKENGEYFISVMTRGMNYADRDSDERLGLRDLPNKVKGEFAEIELDHNNDVQNVYVHKVAGDELLKDQTQMYTRDDILNQKESVNEERILSSNRLY